MVDIAAENKYIRYMMNKLPEEKAQGEIQVGKNDNLWTIAKKAISNGKKVSNAEISEYMLRIAKLNGLDTYEKMNSVKINTKLRMPDKVKSTNPMQQNKVQQRTSSEKSALDMIATLFNDKTIFVENPRLGTRTPIYHVYNKYEKDGYISYKHPVVTFEMQEDGKLKKASFEDTSENIYPLGYDYNLDGTGRIYKNKYNYNTQQVGRLSKEEMQQLEQRLGELREGAKSTM